MGRSPDDIRSDIAETRRAAGQAASDLADQLRPDRRAGQLVEEIVEGAKRQPAAAAAAATLGFLVGRATKRRRRR
jgi:hypothetical protein